MSSYGCKASKINRKNRANWTYSNFHVALPKAALFKLRQRALLWPVLHHRLLGSLILEFTHDHTSFGNFPGSGHITRAILVEQVMRS